MDFKFYYSSSFKNDLQTFFSTIPDESKFHDDRENKLIYSIQQERLTENYKHLDFLKGEQLENFAVALYFVVLFDMVFFKYYKQDYKQFQKLTFYPKFIGNCPKACHFHIHPKVILVNLLKGKAPKNYILKVNQKYIQNLPFMHRYITNFLSCQFPEINGFIFWTKCEEEFENYKI